MNDESANPPRKRMNWQQASREAENRVSMMLQMVAEMEIQTGSRPKSVPLIDYPTHEDYKSILGENPGYDWEEHSMINKATQRLLKRQKLKACMIQFHTKPYFEWCKRNDRNNTADDRAEYASIMDESVV